MSTRIPNVPAYCHHAAKGLAFVKLAGDFVYLGRYGSPDSKAAYERRVAEWVAGGQVPLRSTRRNGRLPLERQRGPARVLALRAAVLREPE